MSYGFICLFRADIAASGLAFRVSRLWLDIYQNHNKNTFLIVNKSLFDKTLRGLKDEDLNNVYIIPEFLGFKLSMVLFVPLLLIYLIFLKNVRKIHLSNGGAFFLKFLKKIDNLIPKNKLILHTSIGSKNLDMITGGNKESKYYKLHVDLLNSVDKVDCLYSPEGFPDYAYKCLQSPGSFSWRYSTSDILNVQKSDKKNDILFCGSFLPQKNYRLAIDAYIDFCNQSTIGRKPRLYMVTPIIPDEIREEILVFNEKKIGEILFLNYDDFLLKISDIYIFLSLQDYDNYPSQSLIESMIFGCTVIATKDGETSRLVDSSCNSLVNKNINEIVEALNFYFNRQPGFNYANNEIILKNHIIEVYSNYFYNNFVK